MKNRHRSIRILIILGALVAGLYLGHHYYRLPFISVHPMEAVPNTAPVILSFPESESLFSGIDSIGFQKSVQRIFPDLAADLRLFRDVLSEVKYEKELTGATLLVITQTGNRVLSMSAIIDDRSFAAHCLEFFRTKPAIPPEKYNYRGRDIFKVTLSGGQSLGVAVFRNLLIIGRLPLHVEESIAQLTEPKTNICKDPDFREVKQSTSAGYAMNLYVNPALIADLFSGILTGEITRGLKDWKEAFHWLRFGISTSETGVGLHGRMSVAEGALLESLPAAGPDAGDSIFRYIPDDVTMIRHLQVPDLREALKGQFTGGTSRFERFFLPWAAAELSVVLTTPFGIGNDDNWVVVLACKDKGQAVRSLNALEEEIGVLQSFDYQTFSVRQLLGQDLFGPLLGTGLKNPFYTMLGKYVIFAGSRAGIEIWLDKYIVGKTLSADPAFLVFYKNNQPAGHLSLYLNTADLQPLLREVLLPDARIDARLLARQLAAFGYTGLQFERDQEVVKVRGNWNLTRVENDRSAVLWRSYLSGDITGGPWLAGPDAEGRRLIVVQDEFHTVYGLGLDGEVHWRFGLSGPILSGIVPVAHYRNDVAELLFNTSDKVYLIDLAGNSAGNFPLTLQARAISGLTVVDFEKDGNYAFFLPAENGGIYGYDKNGQPLSGWNPLPGVGRVRHPLRHFQKGGNDYLIVLTGNASIQAFGRDGNPRFPPVPLSGTFFSPLYCQSENGFTRMVVCDSSGTVYNINPEGESFRLLLPVGNQQNIRFTYADIAGDFHKDYIVQSGPDLAGYYYSGSGFEKAFSCRLEIPQDTVFEVALPGSDKSVIGTLNRDRRKIYLLDHTGKPFPSFPLAGTTAFLVEDLFRNDEPILVTGNTQTVVAYRL